METKNFRPSFDLENRMKQNLDVFHECLLLRVLPCVWWLSISVCHYYWGHSCVRHLASPPHFFSPSPQQSYEGKADPTFYFSNQKGKCDLLKATEQTVKPVWGGRELVEKLRSSPLPCCHTVQGEKIGGGGRRLSRGALVLALKDVLESEWVYKSDDILSWAMVEE